VCGGRADRRPCEAHGLRFTDRQLDVQDTAANVGYVDAIDADRYLVASRSDRIRRCRDRARDETRPWLNP
jgi:hypothetical protein